MSEERRASREERGVGSEQEPSLLASRSSLLDARVAVVHDWLTGMRGGEKVLEAILELLPNAEIFTLFHKPGSVSPSIEERRIHTSGLQKWALRVDDYRKLLPLYPRAIRGWDFSGYELIVSSSHCVAKGARGEHAPHACYCHTPMRYVWDRFDDYFPWRQPLRRMAASAVAWRLRRWDRRTAAHVDRFAANSEFVRDRIRRYYGREADLIHPFVDPAFFQKPLATKRAGYHLVVSALVPYKRVELAIAGAREAGVPLVVIGDGPMRRGLQRQAAGSAEFLGSVSTESLIDRMREARSLILPGVEDFGITPLEAMACGTPVVAFRAGGARETVVEGHSGLFFDEQNPRSLAAALLQADRTTWDREAIRAHAGQFSKQRFQARFREFLDRVRSSDAR